MKPAFSSLWAATCSNEEDILARAKIIFKSLQVLLYFLDKNELHVGLLSAVKDIELEKRYNARSLLWEET